MAERRWRIHRLGRGLFEIAVDDGDGFRPATTAEVDTALRQRELFGAAEAPVEPAGDRGDLVTSADLKAALTDLRTEVVREMNAQRGVSSALASPSRDWLSARCGGSTDPPGRAGRMVAGSHQRKPSAVSAS